MHERDYPPRPDVEAAMNWTEGFSCRREAAIAVGLFPEGRDVTLVAGEDGWFGERLAAAGYRKVFDHGLVVSHVVPKGLGAFAVQRAGRGRGWPQILRERNGASLAHVASTIAKASLGEIFALVVPLRALRRGWRLAALSPRGRRDCAGVRVPRLGGNRRGALGNVGGVLEIRRAGVR